MRIHFAIKAVFAVCAFASMAGLLAWKHYDNTVVAERKQNLLVESEKNRMRAAFSPIRQSGAAPKFDLEAMTGGRVALDAYKGKYVMVNFWATYCAPCLRELPSMYQVTRKYADKPFAVVAISVDESWEPVKELFLKRIGKAPPFPIALDPESKLAHEFGTQKIPETYIIDPAGNVVDKFVSERDWSSAIAHEYFEKLFAGGA